jgi:hypothetical protein
VPQYSVNPAQRILSMVLLRGVVAGWTAGQVI